MSKTIRLARDTNQALKLAEYAAMFMKKGNPSQDVIERTKLFHTDSVLLGLSALALKTNSPTVLKNEALTLEKRSVNKTKKQKWYSRCFGSSSLVPVEKAVLAQQSRQYVCSQIASMEIRRDRTLLLHLLRLHF